MAVVIDCPLGRDRRLTPAGFFFSLRLPTTITEAALENWWYSLEAWPAECGSLSARNAMEWFGGKTWIAGIQISNWILVLAALVVIWLIYSFAH
jgi:hypothetical protein